MRAERGGDEVLEADEIPRGAGAGEAVQVEPEQGIGAGS